MADSVPVDFFTSLIEEIKSNKFFKDPLLPWLKGIRKLKDSLPREILEEKLPRFLQNCVQAFESDKRYRNDLRYVRVWIQLMDFVDDPKVLLKKMEENKIGTKLAVFYQAYALHYEKLKKFEEADNMYHLGVQNLAEPVIELQKSYDHFLLRLEQHKRRKARVTASVILLLKVKDVKEMNHGKCNHQLVEKMGTKNISGEHQKSLKSHTNMTRQKNMSQTSQTDLGAVKRNTPLGDDTVVVKFVDSAIVGKSEAEDACHHGLVDPTINMKEAMNAINNMFREPIEIASRASLRNKRKVNQQSSSGFEIFVDDGGANECKIESRKPFMATKVLPNNDKENAIMRDDTIVHRFVGSMIMGEPEIENACHHGLVDPTINLKEAMDDINGMFGRPMNSVMVKAKKKSKLSKPKQESCGFSILADDDVEEQKVVPSRKFDIERDLFEPTVFTKEALDDINAMFGGPLDF
ncbi:hypothetical protein QJS10_CPB20g00251 [Acorus calamus]|uniref:BUB1 N-terminal domain-containing protein n=1 Tax=Acorus calamus TaxID=4465 RepID=A0AAV9CB19_ACOCL|nr:hypothetical protein QJS10_CPB20g00251 [Acorus calamus]